MDPRQSLDFAIQDINGCGVLVLSDQLFFDWVRVERLDLEIPDAEQPISVVGGAKRFQRRRCRTLAAQFAVDADGLAAWIVTRSQALEQSGFSQVHVKLCGGLAELTCHVQIGDEEADVFARAFVEPAERGVRVTLLDARAFGALPVPASLAVHDVLCTLFSVPRWSETDEGQNARVIGLGDILFRPLDAFLWSVLPPAGWRLPDASDVHAHHTRISEALVEVSYSSSSTTLSSSGVRSRRAAGYLDVIEQHRELDEHLLKGDVTAAGKGWAFAIKEHPKDARFLTDRYLAMLVAEGDDETASRVAKEALSRWSDFIPARMAQAVLALRSENTAEASDHFQAVAQAARTAGDRREAVLALMTAARLLSNDPAGAANLYEQVLELQPDHADARAQVMDALVQGREWDKLLGLAKQPAFVEPVAELVADLMEDEACADELFEALIQAPANSLDEELLLLRVDLLEERARYSEMAIDLAALREQAEREGKLQQEIRVARRLAALTMERLHDEAGAVPIYERALVIDPDDIASAEALAAIFQRCGDRPKQKAALEKLLTITRRTIAGPASEANALRELARISRAASDLTAARSYLVEAVHVAPHDMRTRRQAAEVAEEMGDHNAAMAELEFLAQTLAGRRGPRDAELEEVSTKLAALRAAHPGARNSEVSVPEQIPDAVAPGDGVALPTGAARIHQALRASDTDRLALAQTKLDAGSAREALDLVRGILAAGDLEPSQRLEAHLVAADAAIGLDDLESARVSFEEASAFHDGDLRPIEGLLQIAEAQSDWEGFADLLGRQIRIEEDSAYRARLWYQRAITYRDFLQREPEAYRAFKEAFNCDSEFLEAAQALRAIAMARGEWSLVADLLRREIAKATESIEKAGLHVELSLVHEQRLLDIESAITSYETALALDPEGPVPPGALARLYALTQRYEEAAEAEEKAAQFDKNPAARAERLLRSGEHYERVGKLVETRRMFELAVAVPGGGDASSVAVSKLGRLDDKGANPSKVRELLQSRLENAADDREKVGYLRQLLANAIASGDAKEIDSWARQTLALDANDVSAFQARRRIAGQKEDWKTLATLYRARAKAVDEPRDKATLCFELGRVCLKRLGDLTNAEVALEEVLMHDPKHLGALELLADLAYRRENWDKARQLYAELDPSTSTLGRDVILYRRGELAEMDGDTTGAESAYRAAVEDNPSNLTAHEAIARLALYRGEITHAITALTDMLELIPLDDVDRVTSTRQTLGELSSKAGDATAARFYFELVLGEDHSRVAAMMPLVDIYAGQHEWQKGADMLERLSYLIKTPKKRTNLLYRMGEIYRAHLGDDEGAADAYLKAIDLNAKHVPTLRRLIDYYWRIDDSKSLEEIVVDLETQNQLLVEGTQPETIARIGVSMGIAGNKKRASQMGQALGAAGAGALAATLAEAVALDTHSIGDIVAVAHLLCKPPGPFLAAVRQVLEVRGQKDPQARDLATKL